MKILLDKLGNVTDRHIVHTINRQDVPLRVAVHLFILCGVVLNTGCQANPVEASVPLESTPSPAAESLSTPFPVAPTQGDNELIPSQHKSADAGLQDFIDKAIADLAQRLSLPVNQIHFMEAAPVVWPDASLGCPQPGTVYAQVLTSGFLIHMEAGGKVYEYHTDFNEQVILCEAPRTPIPPVKPGDIQDGQPWMPP